TNIGGGHVHTDRRTDPLAGEVVPARRAGHRYHQFTRDDEHQVAVDIAIAERSNRLDEARSANPVSIARRERPHAVLYPNERSGAVRHEVSNADVVRYPRIPELEPRKGLLYPVVPVELAVLDQHGHAGGTERL